MNISRDLPREGPPARRTNPSQEQRNGANEVQHIMSDMAQPPGQPASATANVASSQEPNLQASTARPTSPSAVTEMPLITNPGDISQQLQLQLDNLRSAETPPI